MIVGVPVGVGEVEGGLGAGQVTQRHRPPGTERSGGPECGPGGGALGEGPVEVEGVGDVDLGLEVQGPGEVRLVAVDGDVAGVDLLPPVGVERLLLGQLEPLDRLRHQPVELRGTDPPRHGGDLGVDPPGRLAVSGSGWRGWWPPPPAGPATRAPARRGPGPTAAAAGAAARGRGPSAASPPSWTHRARHRARRHRTPPPPDTPHPRWAPRAHTHATVNDGGGVDRLRRVQVGPPGSQVELPGRCSVLSLAGGAES